MFEQKKHPLSTRRTFLFRLLINFVAGLSLTFLSLGLGMWGYHHFEGMSWIDAYANASMILSGMGPLSTPTTYNGKLFAGTYALFSGIVFLIIMAIIFAPVFHRFMHKFHMEDSNKN
ncbi:MAG: hypothetical protein H0W88_01665 [Parachlamydiaceae bacterium]|nr:hypothetical protein [Parachlamydiaceae bacterium]